MNKVWLHFKKIVVHKYWVFRYCRIFGITWRGIKHDMSKFSPTEFFESVKYYTGTGSPIDECKRINGYSKAWMHHKGRNDHHYEYWQDNFDSGRKAVCMPYECCVEMLADILSASRAYNGKKFTYNTAFSWFVNKLDNGCAMNLYNKVFIYNCLHSLAHMEKSAKSKDVGSLKIAREFNNNEKIYSTYVGSISYTKEYFEMYRSRNSLEKSIKRKEK